MKPWADRKGARLGRLCDRGHDHGGGSYRYPHGDCVQCNTENSATVAGRQQDAKYHRDNLAARAEKNRIWRTANLGKRAASQAARRAGLHKAMPPWADRGAIAAKYVEARRLTMQTGVQYHVDHIVPLKHPLVSGLHVPANLRVITKSANLHKHNKLDFDERP